METTIPGISFDPLTSFFFILFCIFMVALLASSEAGILSVNKIRMLNLEKSGNKKAKAINKLLKNHDKLFATILTTENAFIVLASSISATLANQFLPGTGTIIASLIMTIVIVVFGEITPKTFAAQNSEKVAMFVAYPISILVRIFSIPIYLLTACTKVILALLSILGLGKSNQSETKMNESEIRMMIDEGALHQDERELLQNVFDFGDSLASQVMTPRTQMKALPNDYTVKEALLEMATFGISKFPVYEETLDNIIGIVNVKELINIIISEKNLENDSIKNHTKPATFIPETKKISEILKMMQEKKTHIFIVADEFGGTEGLITVEDLLAEIVGDIDEKLANMPEEEQEVESVDDKTFVVSGSTTIEDLLEETTFEFPKGDYQTIAGFVLSMMNRIPNQGEILNYKDLEILISEVIGPKIQKVTIKRKN